MSVAAMVALVLMSVTGQAGQAGQEPKTATKTATEPAPVSLIEPDYQLGPGDEISIRVSGLKEFVQSATVSNSGRIRVSFVGVLFVGGMTTVQLEQEIARQVKEHELINEPVVRIQIAKFRARNAFVTGEVNTPGQFFITHETRLLDIVSKAGGMLATAADTGFLYRRQKFEPNIRTRVFVPGADPSAQEVPAAEPPQTSQKPAQSEKADVIEISLRDLEAARPELNIKLEAGDVLYVPRRRSSNFYVIGDVKVPGAYQIPRGSQLTAAQAVVYAGGTLATARQGKGFLMRKGPTGHESLPVDFKAILAGKEPDIPIQQDDIIFIPNSAVRTIGISLLTMIPTIVQQWLIF